MENVGEEGGKKRMMLEGLEKGSVAPLEFSDGVIEQVEAMARNISGGIWALVEGIGRLTKVVEGISKEGVRKEDKEMEMEDVQRMDKQTETEKTVKKRRRVRKKKEKKTAGRKMEIRRWRRWRRNR
jgi:hypothetical protein